MSDLRELSFPVVTEAVFPHGLRCCDCHRGISVGQPFASRVEAIYDDGDSIGVLTCVYCEVSDADL